MNVDIKQMWSEKRMRFLTRRGLSDEQRQILASADQVTFLPMENIGEQGEIDYSIIRDIDDVRNGYTQFFDGDVLVAKITPCFENGKGALVRGTLSGVGFGTTELHVLTSSSEIDTNFLYYITMSDRFRRLGEAAMFGAAGQKRVPEDFIRDYRISIPPIAQQRAIADYLDRETARLDALVTEKKRLLKLLDEKRQSLITCTITRGIVSPHLSAAPISSSEKSEVNMEKRQDIQIGEFAVTDDKSNVINQNSRYRLKYLSTINDEFLGEDTNADFEIQYIDIGNVDSSGNIKQPAWFRFEDAPSRARRCVRDGDVIISTVRTYLQAIAQIHNAPENLVVSTGFAVIRPIRTRFDACYCKFALRESTFLAEVEKRSVGVSYPAINTTELADISVSIYPLSQQRIIADYLDKEMFRLNTIMIKIRETIALLGERRIALITAAVSGQIEVECAR